MKMKRTISLLVVLSMLISFCFTVSATGSINVGSIESNTSERIEEMVSMFYSDYPGYYSVGDAIDIYNPDGPCIYYIIPVFRNQECVGRIEMDVGGGVVLSDDTELYQSIAELDSSDYILYSTGGIVYAESPEITVELYDSGYNISSLNDFSELPYSYKISEITQYVQTAQTGIDAEAVIEQTDPVCSANTEVAPMGATPVLDSRSCAITKFVKQNGHNICWAACVATIVNFKKGTSYTAEAIATAMGHNYIPDSYPGASLDETVAALSKYNLTYSYITTKLSWVKVKSNIVNNTPFIMGMSSVKGGHMLTGYGYQCQSGDAEASSGTRYVRVWEPNGSKLMLQYNASTYSIIGYSWRWISTVID